MLKIPHLCWVKGKVGKYAINNGAKAAFGKFKKRYSKFNFKYTTMISWKTKYQN